ncbi:MAG: flagellar basal body protein [Acidimicrobiales bacterium]|jgi:flagellar basal-body rod protein FlgB
MADAAQSIGILQFALDSVVDQQQVIANNIANNDTPGYQAGEVTFEQSLATALTQGGAATQQVVPEGLPSGSNGNNVSLPTEMTLMQENDLENQTVVNALNDQFSVLSDAITG